MPPSKMQLTQLTTELLGLRAESQRAHAGIDARGCPIFSCVSCGSSWRLRGPRALRPVARDRHHPVLRRWDPLPPLRGQPGRRCCYRQLASLPLDPTAGTYDAQNTPGGATTACCASSSAVPAFPSGCAPVAVGELNFAGYVGFGGPAGTSGAGRVNLPAAARPPSNFGPGFVRPPKPCQS